MPVIQSTQDVTAITASLRRVEGQCRGLQRMIEEERPCAEILQQLSAARNALDTVAFDVAACAVEAEMGDAGLSSAQRGRLRGALAHLRKLR